MALKKIAEPREECAGTYCEDKSESETHNHVARIVRADDDSCRGKQDGGW